MKPQLDWPSYKNTGMGNAYVGIPKTGANYAKAAAVCINSGKCETEFSGVSRDAIHIAQCLK